MEKMRKIHNFFSSTEIFIIFIDWIVISYVSITKDNVPFRRICLLFQNNSWDTISHLVNEHEFSYIRLLKKLNFNMQICSVGNEHGQSIGFVHEIGSFCLESLAGPPILVLQPSHGNTSFSNNELVTFNNYERTLY